MSHYEAKGYYQNKSNTQRYDSQYESPLRLWNLRAKLVGWRESAAFLRLLRHVPCGASVLDTACGTGRYTELMVRQGFQVGGIDISSEMLEFARLRVPDNPNLLFLQTGDSENLPFEDKQFDGITCMRLLHRVPPGPRQQMLREVRRVGRSWAILFFGMSTPWLSFRRAIRSKVLRGRSSNPYPVSPLEMRDELQDLGFAVRDCAWVIPHLADGMIVLVTFVR